MDPKILAAIQLIGGLIGLYAWYAENGWALPVFSIVFILMAIHHFMEKK